MNTTSSTEVEKDIMLEVNEVKKTFREQYDELNRAVDIAPIFAYLQGGKILLESQLEGLDANLAREMKSATILDREVVVTKATLPGGSILPSVEEKSAFVRMLLTSESFAIELKNELANAVSQNPTVAMASDFVVVLKGLNVRTSQPVRCPTTFRAMIQFRFSLTYQLYLFTR